RFLEETNYYRLNIYFHKLMVTPDRFPPNINFKEIIHYHDNDSFLRNSLLKLLEPIEIKIKTHFAYYLSIKYGPECFYDCSLFRNKRIHNEIIGKFKNEIRRNKNDPVIQHHEQKYEGMFPIWVIVEYLSFNSISKAFDNLNENDKKQIANDAFQINEHYLGQWMHVLSVLRNICAHYGYLFRRNFSLRPALYNEFGWNKKQNSKLFAIIRRLSNREIWNDYFSLFNDYVNMTSSLVLRDYGFPDDWILYLNRKSAD
ncbi:MAG: Abi family protein, partial [Eubacteriaceae bacterium]